MRAIGILIIAVFFTLSLGGKKVNGQTVAIGHVCAEVVESVSAASATISDFELTKSTVQTTNEKNSASETLNLGAITINSGKDITCNIVLTSASVTNDQGNAFTIEPAVQNTQTAIDTKSTGLQTVKLGANANLSNDQASGLYEGSYTVIFAYN